MKKILLCAALVCALCIGFACAETARVVTPGGKLNVRKKPMDKSTIVFYVPNYALIEIDEAQEDGWAKITYKKQTGYTKNDYLLPFSDMAGKTLYPDEDVTAVYARMDEQTAYNVLGALDAVTILTVENGFVSFEMDGQTVYAKAEAFSYQSDAPRGKVSMIALNGVSNGADLFDQPKKKAAVIANIADKAPVTVLLESGNYAMVLAGGKLGYMLKTGIRIALPFGEETEISADTLSKLQSKLKKQYQSFGKTYVYPSAVQTASGIVCGFLTEEGKVKYAALLDAEGNILVTRDLTAYAFAVPEPELLPEGEMKLDLSAEQIKTGEILDVTVSAWTLNACAYTLERNGKAYCASEPSAHFAASFRPTLAGDYQLSVTVSDENGLTKAMSASFTVEASDHPSPLSPVYSQVDGTWHDVAYSNKTLEHSGCAIFALSHLLQRMGFDGEDIKPENLAETYAHCLTVDGTNNGRLISEAARAYGFKTQKYLIKDKRKIVNLLKKGAMFSFAIARGHIAMVSGISEDGKMIRVVDSAPQATFERIKNAKMYYQGRSGGFIPIKTLDDMPGARWYFETGSYGGLEYWLDADYIARRGVRLVQMPEAGEQVEIVEADGTDDTEDEEDPSGK